MRTATDTMRIDLRRRRADSLTHAVMDKLQKYIRDEDRRYVLHDLLELFHQEGVEVLTDYDRSEMGLPPRGPNGWTMEELIALEKRRLDVLTSPISIPA